MFFFVEELLASGINLVSKNRVDNYGKNYSLLLETRSLSTTLIKRQKKRLHPT